jgi:hypothetical protein
MNKKFSSAMHNGNADDVTVINASLIFKLFLLLRATFHSDFNEFCILFLYRAAANLVLYGNLIFHQISPTA